MSNGSNAKITVDLTPIERGVIECDASICCNTMDQPETITVVVDGLTPEQINRFCNPPLTVNDIFGSPLIRGLLDSGEKIEGDLAFIKNVGFGSGSVQLECYLGKVSRGTGQAPKDKGHWVFGLANYKIS